ncbi:myosin-2 heavy chain-like [Poeciliopsis prolifica]|uniref:myosin-2 heavy chain-like n=1 Tax=Poeciliopsis prolifica TaxID=188132 RepID=UPI002413D93A|nr:myosin-2 heavy chain-like [Poeciliopsis prolifica]
MRSAALFLLMLCSSVGEGRAEISAPADDGTRTEARPPRDLSVLWEEVQGLKQLVLSLKGEQVEQRQELRTVESRLRDGEMEAKLQKQSMDELQMALDLLLTEQTSGLRKKEAELEEQTKAEISELQSRMSRSENSVEILEKKNSAVAAELPFLQTRLRASESRVEQLRRKDAVLTGRLCNTESLMEELMGQISEIQACNTSAGMESEVLVLDSHLNIQLDALKADIEGQIHELENKVTSSRLRLDDLRAAAEHRLNAAQRQQDELRNHNTELVRRLESSEKQLEDLKTLSTFMETRLGSTEEQLDQLKNQSAVLEVRLSVSERRLEEQETRRSADILVQLDSTEAQLVQLKNHTSVLEFRLRVSEKNLEDLKTENSELEKRLRIRETQLDDQKTTSTIMETRLGSTEEQLDQLKNQSAVLEVRLSVSERRLEEQETRRSELESRLRSRGKQLEDQKTTITELETRLGSTEGQLDQLKDQSADMEIRLGSTEGKLEQLENHTAVQFSQMESRLTDGLNRAAGLMRRIDEKQLEDLKFSNSIMETRLGSTEEQLDQLKNQSAVLEVRLSVSERRLEEQETRRSELVNSLRSRGKQLEDLKMLDTHMETRLGSTEEQLDQLKNQSAVQFSWMESRLTNEQRRTAEFETQLSAVTFRLNVTQELLDELKKQSLAGAAELASLSERLTAAQGNAEDEVKVAFSAGLTDSGIVGPFDEETTLIFSKTITNVGRGYNNSAGVFTAPVTGLYFFSFTAADYLKGYMGLYLYRNEQPVTFSLDLNDHGGYTSMTSAVALQLDRGDRVRLALPASYRLYDDSRNFSVFSGFLLFPV